MGDRDEWQEEFDRSPKRAAPFETLSGIPLDPVYGPDEAELPGQWPYTRGPYASMYRSRLWTMRQFAGFGTAEDTNQRFKELLRSGGNGLSTAFDMPTLLGRDSDDPLAKGEVGRAGVAVDTQADMETLFAGIDLGAVSTSMTINSAAPVVMAMYIGVADAHRGGPPVPVRDHPERHLEGVPGPEGVRLPAPSERAPGHRPDPLRHRRAPPLAPGVDLGLPHPRGRLDGRPGAGLHPGQRVRLRGGGDGRRPARWTSSPRGSASSSTPTSTSSRRSPSTGRPGASGPAGCATTTAPPTAAPPSCGSTPRPPGSPSPPSSPRSTWPGWPSRHWPGCSGGTQSLHTDSYDEALALPTEQAARLALRTQQVIAEETGVVHVADPLGGSWFVESLTDELERQAEEIFAHLREVGGGLDARRRDRLHRGRVVLLGDRRRRLPLPVQRGRRSLDPGRGQRLHRGRRRPDPDPLHRPGGRGPPAGRLWPRSSRRRDDDAVRRSLDRLRQRGGRPDGQPDAGPDRGGRRLRHRRRVDAGARIGLRHLVRARRWHDDGRRRQAVGRSPAPAPGAAGQGRPGRPRPGTASGGPHPAGRRAAR